MDQKFYWGKDEIIDVVIDEATKTRHVLLSTGAFDVPEWEFNAVVKTEPSSDLSDIRNDRANYVVDQIYELFKSLNFRTDDWVFVVQKMNTLFQEKENLAINNMYGVLDSSEIRFSNWEDHQKSPVDVVSETAE